MYQVNGALKHWEEDSYEEGALLGTGGSNFVSIRVRAETLKELFRNIEASYALDPEARGEPGEIEPNRVDYQRLETSDGYSPDDYQIDAWKAGDLKLYICDYSFIVEKVTDVDLVEEWKKETGS